MAQSTDLVLLGKITKPHGIRGEVKVYPYSGEPENFLRYSRVLLSADENEEPAEHTVVRARVQKNIVLMQFEDCITRNDSESLVGSLIYVSEDELPEPAEDEFYLRDLEGKQMVTGDGQLIGTVTGIQFNTGQDLAEVSDGRNKYTIPLVAEFILSIDENEVRVSLPPGLLEIND